MSDEESCYPDSIERLAHSRAAVDLARSRLVYGEWLRRENRRAEAREVLRAAHQGFSQMGAEAFADALAANWSPSERPSGRSPRRRGTP